jgi:hypothetical protein
MLMGHICKRSIKVDCNCELISVIPRNKGSWRKYNYWKRQNKTLKRDFKYYNIRLNCYELKLFFVKEFLHTFGNPATFMATPQYLINASATASVSTPNPLIK